MKVLNKWLYHDRIVFLCKFPDRTYHLFYKSSGLAGYGTKGEVFPILRLKDTIERSPDNLGSWMCFGWLPKFYYYEGKFEEYFKKERREFPTVMHPYLDELESTDVSDAVLEDSPKNINNICNLYIKSKEDYKDWSIPEVTTK